jgi:8-oxo-dGTP diphosphatase
MGRKLTHDIRGARDRPYSRSTVNLYLIRHAHAGDRSRWNGHDAERPLSAKGRDEADDIADTLEGQPIARVLSSPALRCQQTVAGLANRLGLSVEVHDMVREGATPEQARALLDELLHAGDDAVICGHGDLIPELLDGLRRDGVKVNGKGVAKGSVWHLVARDGRVVRATYHRHPEPGALQVG